MKEKHQILFLDQKWDTVFFSKEGLEEVRRILSKYPADKVEQFLFEIDLMCAFQYTLVDNPASPLLSWEKMRKQRKSIKTIIRGLRKALQILEDIKDQSRSPYLDLDPKVAEFGKAAAHEIIKDSLGPKIDFFENIFEKMPVEKGRPASYDDIVERLAHKYQKYIGKPSTTKQGSFFSVVQIVLSVLDSKEKTPVEFDPSRAIQKAIKKLKEQSTTEGGREGRLIDKMD